MKCIFFGTSEFAVAILKRILKSRHSIGSVVTAPDSKGGRGLKLKASPVRVLAESAGIPVHTPADVNDPVFVETVRDEGADLFIVAAYGQIFSKELLGIPKIYPINAHASILPKYRGAAPIARAIIDGCTESGITLIVMNDTMDAGDMLLQRRLDIDPADTSHTLSERLSLLAAEMTDEIIENIKKGKMPALKKQDPKFVTFAPKITKKDGRILWDKAAGAIDRQIRALQPWPCAYSTLKGKMIKIYAAEASAVKPSPAHRPGLIIKVDSGAVEVATGEGVLAIRQVQLEGKKRMNVDAFLRGYRAGPGDRFGC